MYNYTSGILLPLSCPSDVFSISSTGAFIDVPVGALGIQIKQVVYGHRDAAPPMLTNMSVIANGYTGEINVPSTVKNCCTTNNCDLANYAKYTEGTWFESPICGQQSACGPPVQWYIVNFEATPVGTCNGCGIIGSGTIDMTIDFQGSTVEIPDYGNGGTIYVSYYGIFPSPSPSETTSQSPSPSETTSPSISTAITPSSSLSQSSSISASITRSSSKTGSTSVTPTPVNCASRIILNGGYNYTVELNSDYDPGQDISYQLLSGDCSTTINQCAQICSGQTNCVGIIMDTAYVHCWTKPTLNTRTFVAARVAWHRTLIPSITPSSTISPSVTQSSTISPSLSRSETSSYSLSPSETSSETPSPVSPSTSSSVSVSTSETSTETPSPVSPSMSPSVTISSSATKSVTASRSPSLSPVGVCNHARVMMTGITEGVQGDVFYYINHWINITHPYVPNYILIGKNPVCSETTTTCTCVYTQGSSFVCPAPRQATITYTYGTQTSTVFTQQNPGCVYYFSTTLNVISPTPSSSISPSMTPSVSPSTSPIDGTIELIADSTGDFQPVQGNNGWYYNYYNESMLINTFPNFGPNPLGVPNNWLISGSYCRINSNAIHGSSTNYCDSSAYGWCYPSLHWINSNYSFENFIVNVKASHTLYNPPGIDGVKLNISINNNQIDSFQTPFTINKNYTAKNVTDIELVLDPINGCFSDKTDQNVKVYAYMPMMFSVTPSSSPSVSLTATHSISKSQSVSVSSSQTPSQTQTSSTSVSLTTTPLFFMTAWPTLSSTSTKTPTRTAAYMMTPWPSKGYSQSASMTPIMYAVPYPSTSPSEIPDAIQAAILEENKSENTAKVLTGVGVGVAALGLGAAAVQVVQGLQAANNLTPRQGQGQNDDQQRRRRRRRGSEDSEDEEEKKRRQNNDEDEDEEKRQQTNEDEEVITRRPSIEKHIDEVGETDGKVSSTTISIPSSIKYLNRGKNETRKKQDEKPDYEPLIQYFYYKKLHEHIITNAEK